MVEDDAYYMRLAKKAAECSTCRKKQLGVVLVTANGSTLIGYNGPPSYLGECSSPCPRADSHSGTDLHLCPAIHAERLPILMSARLGLCTLHTKLYSYMGVPCKDCLLELITAGVYEIICINETYYDELSKKILKAWIDKGGIFRVMKVE